MGYGDFQYYGLMNNNKYGWNPDTMMFKPGKITGASQSGFMDNTMYGIGNGLAPNRGIAGSGLSLLPREIEGPKGSVIHEQGILSPIMGVWDSYNSWNQGNKMMDMYKDAFQFSKDQFWNNFLMQRDAYNTQKNKTNRYLAQWDYLNKNPGAEGYRDFIAENNPKFNDSSAITSVDGTTRSNVVNVPTQYMGENYGSNVPNQLANTDTGSGTAGGSTMDSTNPNAAQNQVKATPANSSFVRKKLGT